MQKIHILLVGDNDGDIVLMKEAKIKNGLSVANDGEQALVRLPQKN